MKTKKTKTKKVAKKVVKKGTPILDSLLEKSKAIPEKKKYHLSMKFNDNTYECDTDDLASAIMAFKPIFLKTKVIFRVEKDGKVCERLVFLFRAKQIFRNKLSLDIFINKLIFK